MASKTALETPRGPQVGPERPLRRLPTASDGPGAHQDGQGRSREAPKGPQEAQGGPTMPPRGSQEAPRRECPQRLPR
eukprot:9193412-Pyramimonas_sp.AAC.1